LANLKSDLKFANSNSRSRPGRALTSYGTAEMHE